MSTAPRSSTLPIPLGQAIEVVLRDTRGKQLNTSRGERILYFTIDGEEIWTSPDESRQIQELGLRPNQPLRIFRRKQNGEFFTTFSHVADEQVERRPPSQASNSLPVGAATSTIGPRSAQDTPPSQVQNTELPKLTQISQDMIGCGIAAIDALLHIKQYAEKHGVQYLITPEMIQAHTNTLYIQFARNGGGR